MSKLNLSSDPSDDDCGDVDEMIVISSAKNQVQVAKKEINICEEVSLK